jgi:peroxiredoxin
MSARPLRLPATLLILALAAISCTGDGGPDPTGPANITLSAQVATADLYVGAPQRVQLGISGATETQGVQVVSYGTIEVAFSFLPEGEDPVPGPTATATYLPAYLTDDSGTAPALTNPSTARGTYQTTVEFDRPGSWTAEVTAQIEGLGTRTLSSAFPVAAEPAYPAPGDKAPRTRNATIDSKGVEITAIDSAAVDGALPDPALHEWTVADALAKGRPIVVIVGTPAYCTSQFCGPENQAIADLQSKYEDRAVFIHLEVWKQYAPPDTYVINEAAAEWIFRDNDFTEPWTFLVGPDGRIVDRWMPLFDPDEIARALRELPPIAS